MKYKTLYAAHEARMWLKTLIGAGLATAVFVAANPEIKDAVKEKVRNIKEKAKNKFKKKPIKIVVVDEEGKPV